MAFTVSDVDDLIRILQEHPEWREKLRPVILGEEVLAIPGRMDRVEAALAQLTERVASLEGVVRQLTESIGALTARMDAAEKRLERVEERLERVEARLEAVEGRLGAVEGRLGAVEGRLGNVEGELLEARYDRNMSSWFSEWLRRPRRASWDELGVREAERAGAISADERRSLMAVDMLVQGVEVDDVSAELTLVVEISNTINRDDVERADSRAAILAKAGHRARGFVGGYRITTAAQDLAEDLNVIVDLHRPAA